MAQLLWDASALSKRYSVEVGSDTVDALFDLQRSLLHATTYLCYAEACASLRRKLNQGTLDRASFAAARLLLHREVLLAPDYGLMTITDEEILAGVILSDQHNLNSTDAAILATYLGYARVQPPGTDTCVLVAADQRLVRAAISEGMSGLNPELIPAVDVSSLLGSL